MFTTSVLHARKRIEKYALKINVFTLNKCEPVKTIGQGFAVALVRSSPNERKGKHACSIESVVCKVLWMGSSYLEIIKLIE